MNQEERLNYLLEEFKLDSIQYKDLKVKNNFEEKRMVLRSLMNIRLPKEMQESVLFVQDEFLQEESVEKGIVDWYDIPTIDTEYESNYLYGNKVSIWQGDITRLSVDAIVNAANSQMLGCFIPCHKCIDNAIHSAAGVQLRDECNHIMQSKRSLHGLRFEEPTGQAEITKGYNLPSKYVIHTVGPMVSGKLTQFLRNDLANCYNSCLKCAIENGIRSIAFCCISTGEFRFPNEEASKIAIKTVTEFLKHHGDKIDRVIFNVFTDLDKALYKGNLCQKLR